MKTYRERRQFVLEWLRAAPGTRSSCNVLDSEFVDAYVEFSGAPVWGMIYGANKCRQLGRDLARMQKECYLKRSTTGLEGMAGMGFPRWVYSYFVNPHMEEIINPSVSEGEGVIR